ncbi:MAG: glycosyltransferase family 4 protein [Thermoleophilia bacterium]
MAHLLPLLSALRRTGCDANLLCLGGGGLARAAAERGLPVEVLPMTTPWDPRVLPALRRRLTGAHWDVIHTHGMRANIPVRLAWGRTACLFTTVHSDLRLDYSDPLRRRVFPALDRWTRARVDRIVCVSEDLRRRLLAGGVAEERLLVVHSGVESDGGEGGRGPGEPFGPGASARSYGLYPGITAAVWGDRPPPPNAPRVGTVARLVEVKDIDLFVEVIARVASVVSDVRAAVVGSGPESERLRALSTSQGMDGVVTFPGDVRPGSAVVREFDVFLLTSVSEGIPMAVLEAMSAGVPVVATDVGGMSEVVQEGVTGSLVSRGSDRDMVAAGLAARILDLLSDSGLRGRMGAAARALVRRDFSADAAARVLLEAYRDCLAARATAVGGAPVGGATAVGAPVDDGPTSARET